MSSLKDIGQLIQVPVEQIELAEEGNTPAYQVAALSEKLQQPNLRNWVPVIVQEPLPRQYRVVGNSHILTAMEAAGQEYIWVAVIPDDPAAEEQIKVMTGQLPLRVNVCTADYEMILLALQHLRQTLGSKAKLDITLVAERIVKAPGRRGWTSLDPLTKLKCGLTKSKLKELAKVFEAIPQPIEIKPVVLNKASEEELLESLDAAASLPEAKLIDVDLEQLAHAIANEPNRKYWLDLKPLTKLKNGLTTSKLKGLEKVFQLDSKPAPKPNTVRYLLERMKKSELTKEAKQRNITIPKGATKSELVDILCGK